jgi:hypothetical protein
MRFLRSATMRSLRFSTISARNPTEADGKVEGFQADEICHRCTRRAAGARRAPGGHLAIARDIPISIGKTRYRL